MFERRLRSVFHRYWCLALKCHEQNRRNTMECTLEESFFVSSGEGGYAEASILRPEQ
ncbi:hypothetical protein TWF225_006713 [Orbilia oligospora]|uniref:Uncharacterized protein n=1 Tax=Orbilia oligospora TaxID=2813651 RepID=A0A7C8PCG3_ORBOL|nr:hypothetical protein TWF751_010612 [Orbilia oligospora]KAF3181158.1 hypothetical protein TWF225_006713 [Orbilia oligospora]KAF3245344.1 hypothetical protein TWF217_010480 [Orbilia oligospora]KAF3270191.1 hypothetical protein TWF128_004007 [Orbilia oligospora]KAF3287839.1 hypothetical protein TWF132_008222 [Orbilia oligospora]